MKQKLFLLIVYFSLPLFAWSQTVIQMTEDMGVYKIPCEVNGLKAKMIFDTGASVVSLSRSFAEILIENDKLASSDFIGLSKSVVADGRTVEQTNIILRTMRIGDITLKDVKAVVVNEQKAPLLLGQSAIQQLGEISIKGDKLYIQKGGEPTSSSALEKWDEKNYTYSNYAYGFGWNLPKEFKWERVEGYEKHTAFRVEGAPFVVFANVHVQEKGGDLWEVFDQFVSLMEQLDASLEKRTGQLNYERTYKKCTLFGQHAIKTTFKEYFKDSRYDEPIENYAEEYILIKDGYNYTFALKLPKSVYDEYDCKEDIENIFKGLRLSVKH
ncbi:MAG: retroviral-like aspartic protease family protein [Bacteroidaceae bacterium]|nr:retroviral-like aspartic protease family protein [Bacteroidaceae bacterium]